MKHLFFIAFLMAVTCLNAQNPIQDCEITQNFGMMSQTFTMCGSVRVVTDPKEYVDFEVKVVKGNEPADLHVKVVKRTPYECGEWRWVNSNESFTIRFVDKWPSFTIKFVGENEISGATFW
jgi:hypothetical protein